MKYFFQRDHRPIWQGAVRLLEKIRHLPLPAFIHFSYLGASTVKIRGFQIPDEKAVGPEEHLSKGNSL
jgi:hypothetical protein